MQCALARVKRKYKEFTFQTKEFPELIEGSYTLFSCSLDDHDFGVTEYRRDTTGAWHPGGIFSRILKLSSEVVIIEAAGRTTYEPCVKCCFSFWAQKRK